jgi:hypothetical protein
MARWCSFAALALAGLVAWGNTARAQIVVRAPFVHVQVGPGGVYVQAPGVIVDIKKMPHRGPIIVGNPPAGAMEPLPRPALGSGPIERPPTIKEFAETFRPREGTHQAVVIHPTTGQPVKVEFTLPAGTPEVRVNSREVEFDYGKSEVEVRFLLNGGVKVDYKE